MIACLGGLCTSVLGVVIIVLKIYLMGIIKFNIIISIFGV
jgi:hypothetical protein